MDTQQAEPLSLVMRGPSLVGSLESIVLNVGAGSSSCVACIGWTGLSSGLEVGSIIANG